MRQLAGTKTRYRRVAGAGLSGAKEAPGFRAGALQPRPPINPLLTEARRGPNEAECFLDEPSLVRHGDRGCLSLTKLLPTDDLDPHGFNFLFHGGVGEYSPVVITQKVAAGDALQFGIVGTMHDINAPSWRSSSTDVAHAGDESRRADHRECSPRPNSSFRKLAECALPAPRCGGCGELRASLKA